MVVAIILQPLRADANGGGRGPCISLTRLLVTRTSERVPLCPHGATDTPYPRGCWLDLIEWGQRQAPIRRRRGPSSEGVRRSTGPRARPSCGRGCPAHCRRPGVRRTGGRCPSCRHRPQIGRATTGRPRRGHIVFEVVGESLGTKCMNRQMTRRPCHLHRRHYIGLPHVVMIPDSTSTSSRSFLIIHRRLVHRHSQIWKHEPSTA